MLLKNRKVTNLRKSERVKLVETSFLMPPELSKIQKRHCRILVLIVPSLSCGYCTLRRPFILVHPKNTWLIKNLFFYNIVQQPPRSPFSKVRRAARVAASKTSSTPSPVREEHSRYFRAPISRAIFDPSFSLVNGRDFLRISSCAIGSSLRSFFSPTRIIGTSGQRSLASSTHFSRISLMKSFNRLSSRLYLVLDIIQGVWSVDRKSDQDNMCFRICQRSQSLVVLLPRRIP